MFIIYFQFYFVPIGWPPLRVFPLIRCLDATELSTTVSLKISQRKKINYVRGGFYFVFSTAKVLQRSQNPAAEIYITVSIFSYFFILTHFYPPKFVCGITFPTLYLTKLSGFKREVNRWFFPVVFFSSFPWCRWLSCCEWNEQINNIV